MRSFAEELIKAYDVRPEDCGPKLAGGLSGGNQQKIIIGREIAQEPKLLIAIQPTRGLDVGAIENVHKMLIRERDKGVAVLLISFELDEVMNVSDRIAVIYDGHIQQIFPHGTVDNRTLGRVMAGGSLEEAELEQIRKAGDANTAAGAEAEAPAREPAAAEVPAEEAASETVASVLPAAAAAGIMAAAQENMVAGGVQESAGPAAEEPAEPEPETSTVPAADGGVELQNTEQMKETLAQMQKSLAELQKQIENMQKALAGMQ